MCNRLVFAAACAALTLGTPVEARQKPDLTSASLAELMQMTVEPVFGASLRLQPVTQAPASVTIVTADEIRRYGYRTLADILNGVLSFQISSDRNYSYAGIRGVAQPGDYNTRVLLMVNGHRLNDGVYDQAPIGAELGLDPETFARVEVIRGPGSALYGTSAFFATVNVVTKTPEPGTRGSVWSHAGSLGTWRGGASIMTRAEDGLQVGLHASGFRSSGVTRLYFPEFDTPESNRGVAENLDGEDAAQALLTAARGRFALTAGISRRDKTVPTAAFDTAFNAPGFSTRDERAFADLSFAGRVGSAEVLVRLFADRYQYRGSYPGSDRSLFRDRTVATTWGTEARISGDVDQRHRLTAGVELRHNVDQDQSGRYDAGVGDFFIEQSSGVLAAYAQDEIRFAHRWRLVAGGRVDRYAGFTRLTPRAALIFNPTFNGAVKYLFGSAFRAPNAYELGYFSRDQRPDLQPETITTHELVWEQYTGTWLRTSASLYRNDVRGLIALSTRPDGEFVFRNLGRVRSHGLGVEAEVRDRRGLQILASYQWQRSEDAATTATLVNSPAHTLTGHISLPTPWRDSFVSVESRLVGSRRTLDGAVLAPRAQTHLHANISLGSGFSVDASIRDLFNQRAPVVASEEHRQRTLPGDGRTMLAGLRWSLGGK